MRRGDPAGAPRIVLRPAPRAVRADPLERRNPMRKTLSLLALAAVLALPAEAKVTRYLTGNAADVVVPLAGPAHDFGGGGTDVDAALQWIIDQVRGCTSCSTKIDVVILRSSGSNGYNDYIYAMNGVDSVETLVITKASDSNTAAVQDTVLKA